MWLEGVTAAAKNLRNVEGAIDTQQMNMARRPTIYGLAGKNVFPQYDEGSSDANTQAEIWAHKKGVEIGDRKVVHYRKSWYIIEKIDNQDDDNGYSYRVVKHIPKSQYKHYKEILEANRDKTRKNGVERRYYPIDNIDRRRLEYSEGRSDTNDDVFEYSTKDNDIYRLAENENEKRYNQFNSRESNVGSDEDRTGIGTAGLKTNAKFMLRNPVEQTRDLIAVHNMTQDELLKSLQLGGLPMPSIAIIKAQEGHSEYGDVSLVFPKDTIDPSMDSRNKVYSIDAWTPTFPSIEYQVNEKKATEIYRRANKVLSKPAAFKLNPVTFHYDNLEDRINSYGGEQGFIEHYKDDYGMKQFYLAEQDKAVQERYTEKRTELSDADKEFYQFLADYLGAEALSEEATENGREWNKRYGDKLDQARIEYTRSALGELSDEEEANLKREFEEEKGLHKVRILWRIMRYLKDGGVTVDRQFDTEGVEADIDKLVNQAEYEKWLKDFFKGIEQSKGIYNGTDYYTYSGNRRSFAQTHYEINLENIVKAMLKQENGSGIFGNLHLYGVAGREYQNVDEIRADKERLNRIDEEAYSQIKQGFADRYSEIVTALMEKDSSENELIAYDHTAGTIQDTLRRYKTKSGIYNDLKRWLPNTTEMVVDDLISLVQDIASMPTEYFEAKPRRAVMFDEVATAIIPDTASAELKTALDNANVKYVEYTAGDEESRKAALNSMDDVKFMSRDEDFDLDFLFDEDGSIESTFAKEYATHHGGVIGFSLIAVKLLKKAARRNSCVACFCYYRFQCKTVLP